jgi:hypothetical protein
VKVGEFTISINKVEFYLGNLVMVHSQHPFGKPLMNRGALLRWVFV